MSQPDPTPPAPMFFSEPEHQPFVIGSGRTGALLLHGFMGTPAEMRPLASELAAVGLGACGPLLPGFGADIARLPQMDRRQWLAAAQGAWGDVRAAHAQTVLIGFSMGGALALHLAAAHPPDALVLIAPFWRAGGWQFNLLPVLRHVVPSIAPFQKADFTNPEVHAQLTAIAPDIDLSDPETQRFLREEVRLPLSVLDELRRLGKEAYELAATVRVPTLVIQGQQDALVAPEASRQLAARLPLATYTEVPGDHGLMHPDSPGAYSPAADVLSFLAPVLKIDPSPV